MVDSTTLAVVAADIRARFITTLSTEWLPEKRIGDRLYCGSVDGMTAAAFHERCDGKGPTLTLIRADEGGRACVFGGYTSVSWVTPAGVGMYVPCEDAFLFSVAGPHCSVTRFPVRRGFEGWAMFCASGLGPSFATDLEVRSGNGGPTAPFDGTSNCEFFGHPKSGVYADTVGMGPATFTGTTVREARFIPVDMEVYAVSLWVDQDAPPAPMRSSMCTQQ